MKAVTELLTDLKGWRIDITSLPSPEREKPPFVCCHDHLFTSDGGGTACLFYTVFEYRSGCSAGLMAIYENKARPDLIVNPANTWFEYNGLNTVTFGKQRKVVFLRKTCYNNRLTNPDIPFCIIDVDRRLFSFYEFDFTSRYYMLNERDDGCFETLLLDPNAVKSVNRASRSGDVIDLDRCIWFDLSDLENFCRMYWEYV